MASFSAYINVKDHGAVGNGVTDDTNAIKAAIALVPASGGTVYFPRGAYLISSSLDFSAKPFIQFIGDGIYESEILSNETNGQILSFKYTGSIPKPTLIQISSLRLTAAAAGVTGIYIAGASTSGTIEDVFLSKLFFLSCQTAIHVEFSLGNYYGTISINGAEYGIYSKVSGDTVVSNVQINDSVGSSSTGFWVIGDVNDNPTGEGFSMSNCIVNVGAVTGLLIQDQHFGTANGCSLTSCTSYAVRSLNTPGGRGSANWQFSACVFQGNSTAVSLDTNANLFQFAACEVYGSQYGFQLNGSSHVVSGCVVTGGSIIDVLLQAVIGCNITGNISNSTAPAQVSIGEQSPADYNLISSNVVQLPVVVVGPHSIQVNTLQR